MTLQFLAVYLSPLAAVLGTVKPSAIDWIVIASCGLLTIGIVELTKFWEKPRTETSRFPHSLPKPDADLAYFAGHKLCSSETTGKGHNGNLRH